jgi:hypothetical protein
MKQIEQEIEAQGGSLKPGWYAGGTEWDEDDGNFFERPEELDEGRERLDGEARVPEERIAENYESIMRLQ